jgi:primosomal protein N' (replication factor Y)
MIKISLKHKDRASLNRYSDLLGNDLKHYFGKRVLGPEFPIISQIQWWYIKTIIVKVEKEKPLTGAKEMIREAIARLEKEKGAGSLRIAIDVDPY